MKIRLKIHQGMSIELKRGGKPSVVDKGNVEEYVRLAKDFNFGPFIVAKVARFLKSLQTNIQRDTLQLLTAQELVDLVAGGDVLFTVESCGGSEARAWLWA
jgi:hypothetical protein